MEALNIHQRLAAVMQEVTYIQKEKKTGMNYTIVSHDAVTAKVRPALLKHGIVYYPVRCAHAHNGNRAEAEMTIRFVNIDAPADFFEVQTFGYGVDPQDKGPGKAMSYAVKYALLKALGLETGDDADMDNVDYSPADPAAPPFDARAATDRVIAKLKGSRDMADLADRWKSELATIDDVKKADADIFAEINAAKDGCKTKLQLNQEKAA